MGSMGTHAITGKEIKPCVCVRTVLPRQRVHTGPALVQRGPRQLGYLRRPTNARQPLRGSDIQLKSNTDMLQKPSQKLMNCADGRWCSFEHFIDSGSH